MPKTEIPIFNTEKFEEKIKADNSGLTLKDDAIWYNNPKNGDKEQIASYKDGKLAWEFSLEEHEEVLKQLSEMAEPDRLKLDDDTKRSFAALLDDPNSKYVIKNGGISSKVPDEEICKYNDGTFTLTKTDDASLQKMVDMMAENGVKAVMISPDTGHVAEVLKAKFAEKKIDVNNQTNQQEQARQQTAGWHQQRNDGPVQEPVSPDAYDKAIEKLDQHFADRFVAYDDDVTPDGFQKFHHKDFLTRGTSGYDGDNFASQAYNDIIRNHRMNKGAAFEINPRTLAVRSSSESRADLKGMVAFANAAHPDRSSKKKLRFDVISGKAAEKIWQEAKKKGIPLNQIEFYQAGVKMNFKPSLVGEAKTSAYMALRFNKYADARRKLLGVGKVLDENGNVVQRLASRRDPQNILNNKNSLIKSDAPAQQTQTLANQQTQKLATQQRATSQQQLTKQTKSQSLMM